MDTAAIHSGCRGIGALLRAGIGAICAVMLLAAAAVAQPAPQVSAQASHDLESITSELSPAVMYRSARNSLSLLRGMPETFGVSGPAYVAAVQGGQVKVTKVDGTVNLPTPEESWLLVWFAGGEGWEKLGYGPIIKNMFPPEMSKSIPAMDIPCLIVLEKKPRTIAVSAKGVDLGFDGATGWVGFMPLYGVRAPLAGETAGWAKGLPGEVTAQCRRWNAYLKYIPIDQTESYSVDIAKDAVTVTQNYRWLAIEDQWNTKGIKAAPQPPMIALAKGDGYPAKFEPQATDSGVATRFGPLEVCEGVDSNRYIVTGMLKYINEWPVYTGQFKTPDPLLDQMKTELATSVGRELEQAKKNTKGYEAAVDGALLVGAAPFLSADKAKEVTEFTRTAEVQRIFNRDNYRGWGGEEKYTLKSGRKWIGTKDGWEGDVEPLSFFAIQAVGAYCSYTGDWSVLKDQDGYNTFLKPIAVQKVKGHNWLIQGRENSGGDSFHNMIQGICLMTRMAGKMNDADEYAEGAYVFAKKMANYHAFARSSLKYARQFPVWATPLMPKRDDGTDRDTVVWDYYIHHGPNFTYVGQRGFYGDWTGYYEHIARSNMPGTFLDRYWKDYLKDRAVELFDRNDQKQFDTFKIALVSMFQSKVLDWPLSRLDPKYSGRRGGRADALITTLEAMSQSKTQRLWDGAAPADLAAAVAKERDGLNKDRDADTFQWMNLSMGNRGGDYAYPFPFVFGWTNPRPLEKVMEINKTGTRLAASGHLKNCFGLGFVWPTDGKPLVKNQSQRLGWVSAFHACDGQ